MTALKITIPDMGDFKEVEIIEVLVKEGQKIKKNDSLITLESDKSSVEVPATHAGIIQKINLKVGDKVNQGDLILTLDSEEKEIKQTTEKKTENTKNISPKIESTKLSSTIFEKEIKLASRKVRKLARALYKNVCK